MDVQTIDLRHRNQAGVVASYLLRGAGGPVLVDTGPTSCLPALAAGLAEHGLETGDVRHVFFTHIHLDHAGAAGWWAQQGATVYVHPRGERHLLDPSRLLASASRLYGDLMDELWGEVLPASENRVRVIEDGETVSVAGLEVEALATPGHASHHHVYRVEDVGLMGDLAGIVVPGTGLVDLPTPPPEFDPELWRSSLERVRSLGLQTIYPTHFGGLDNVEEHLTLVAELVAEAAAVVRSSLAAGRSRDLVEAEYGAWRHRRLTQAGASPDQIEELDEFNPPEPSAAGILRFWKKAHGLEPGVS